MPAGLLEKKNFDAAKFFQKYAVIIVWALLFIAFSIWMPTTFFSWLNIRTMLGSQAVLVVTALAILIPITAGDYDMTPGALLTLVNIVFARLNVTYGLPIGACIIISLLIGAAVGAINGLIVTKFEINPFIVTMGMQTLLAGIALLVSLANINGVSQSLKNLVYVKRIGGISLSFFYALILVIVLTYIFEKTAAGKRVLIIGRSDQVAKLSGINVSRTRFMCFVFSGIVASIAGIMYTGILGAGSPTSGLSYLMPAFAAVFLGSTCLKPGRFNAPGTIIAVYFLSTGTNGLSLRGAQSYISNIFYGAALIVAVVFSVLARRSREKKEMKAAVAKREAEEKELMQKLKSKSVRDA